MRKLVDHVAALGHRRIGYVGDNPGFETTLERIDGCRDCLQGRGVPFDERLLVMGNTTTIAADGPPGPAGGIRAVAEGEWAATFTCPAGGPQAVDMAKPILLDCAETVPTIVTMPTTAITPDNAKQMMSN